MVFVTEIDDRTSPKPFLGGWRDVARDLEYHDATCQTPIEFVVNRPRQPRISRPIQTSAIKNYRSRSVLAGRVNRAVQANPLIPDVGECVIEINDLMEQSRRIAAVIIIQRFYRAYRERKYNNKVEGGDKGSTQSPRKVVSFASDNDDKEDDRSTSDNSSSRGNQSSPSQIAGELHIIHPSDPRPHVRSEFAMLRSLLDRWGVVEEARIREIYHDEIDRIAARKRRLEREVEILRAIDDSHCEIVKRRAERARARFLEELAKPVELEVPCSSRSKPCTVHLDTLSVQYARELRDLYDTLLLEEDDELDELERTELLFALKRCIDKHTCPSSLSLERLIDQELYLLTSHIEPTRLKYLRSRIRLGFLRIARGALGRDSRLKNALRTRLCLSCGRLKRLESFVPDHRERISRTCIDCEALGPKRRDAQVCSEIYEMMLRELRRNESVRSDGASSLAFVIGPRAIGYLINDIWHGRSAISECSDLERMRLVRFDPLIPWSPWNTLLTTRSEALMHESLMRDSCANVVYDEDLLRKFRRLNLQAKLYFRDLAKYAPDCALTL